MEPRIEILPETRLIGQQMQMSFAANKTVDLWRGFMPRRKEIKAINDYLYAVEIYPPNFFGEFNPNNQFQKWAAVEVADFENIPGQMESLLFPSGEYAVFIHKGPASEGERTYRYIFQDWLPISGYELDSRPHFALIGEKYKNDDPDSEEEIWIPVKPKNNASVDL